SPTASGRSIRPRSTGWSASSRRSSGSTKQQRSAESSSCCRPPDRPLRAPAANGRVEGGLKGGPEGKLARLRGARRIWAVGSVHGEAERLSRLHDQIAARFVDGDRLIYLGNYLGHGSAVVATIDELVDFRSRIM